MKTALLAVLVAAALPAQSLRGVVDIHAHSAPDSVPRSIDSLALARLAKDRGFRGIVLKNHYEPTAALAALARTVAPGLEVFGGIALNRTVGGINVAAVERMAQVEGGYGRIVWMPTFDSENQVRKNREKRPFVSVSQQGKLLPEVLRVLDAIAKNRLVLATGHSTAVEVLMLVREAKSRGVGQIVVTHPLGEPVAMSIPQMREAANMGAYLEFVGNATLGILKAAEFADFAKAMREIGIEHCILSSDFGQKGNPLHPDGLVQVFAGLRGAGLTEAEIDRMVKTNPARLLSLE